MLSLGRATPKQQARAVKELRRRQQTYDYGVGIARLQPHTAQKQVLREAARFNIVDCGRRWGKTMLGQDLDLGLALKGYPVGWFSPTYGMMTDVWREFEQTLYPIITGKNKTERYMAIEGGGKIDFWSLDNPDMARGRKYKRVVIDEAAMAPLLEYAWRNVIRPTLTDFRGDAWFLSTPKGRNFFWKLFILGMDETEPEYKAWQMPTGTNKYIDKEEIEAARLELPQEVFRQEYLAEFLENEGSVFRNIHNCIRLVPEYPQPGGRYVMGVDWAMSKDWTVLIVMDADTKQVVDIDRFNQISWGVQRGRLHAMADKWEVGAILAEANAMGDPNVEQLNSEGLNVIGFTTTNQSKAEIIQALALAFERVEIGVTNDRQLLMELEAFEVTRLPSGSFRYSAPAGIHDDMVMALALAYWQSHNVYEDAGVINYQQPYRFSDSPY